MLATRRRPCFAPAMRPGHDILYLAAADVEGLGLDPDAVEAAIEAMFRAKAAGTALMKPKMGLEAEGGAVMLASPAVVPVAPDKAWAGVKWLGVADNHERNLPHIVGTILLSDGLTGMPLAVMDAAWITGARTAAISAVAARRMAPPDSETIAFVACGLQARTHLAALRPHFPLQSVRACSRRLETAEAFAAEAAASGLDAVALEDPRDAIEGADIVVTTTPLVPRTAPFLDAARVKPGGFIAAVDLGISWHAEALQSFDRLVTDDLAQAATERVVTPRPFDGEIADLVVGKLDGRPAPDARTALIFAGLGLADVAAAALVYEQAREAGVGRVLPR